MHDDTQATLDKIAIIGVSARYPGAKNIYEFWDNLYNGVESVNYFDKKTALASGANEDDVNNPLYVMASGKLENIELFDADFFGFTPKEAAVMDPQQRIFFECAYEALEDAGLALNNYNFPVGVYAGANTSAYFLYHLLNKAGIHANLSMAIGNEKDYLATRFSYAMNLKGPSVTVQTSCSTSLTAVAGACDGLLNYHCDVAIAGGVSVRLPQELGYLYQEGMILSPDGHCRPFDEKAQGTIFTSGAGVVVLKRYEDAIKDRDNIYAVIRSFAINNDGSDKIGYTAPSREGQASVIATAQSLADINPDEISYIEAHGTGTSLGDPIEIEALTNVFKNSTERKQFCAVGSVKSNIGHAISAAGIAGFIKTVLAIKNKKIPPSINFDKPNPKIDFKNSPFYVNNKLIDWNIEKRIAGVSSFGIGGTNIHVILEDADEYNDTIEKNNNIKIESESFQLLTISAQSKMSLQNNIDNLKNHLNNDENININDAVYTLNIGRKSFNIRKSFIFKNKTDLNKQLNECKIIEENIKKINKDESSLALILGNQPLKFDRIMSENNTFIQNKINECIQIIQKNNKTFNFNDKYTQYSSQNNISQENYIIQFIISYAIVEYLKNFGINPDYFIGIGIGEILALVETNTITLEDGLNLFIKDDGDLSQSITNFKITFTDNSYFSTTTGDWITENNLKDITYWQKILKNQYDNLKSLENFSKVNNVFFLNLNFEGNNPYIENTKFINIFNSNFINYTIDKFSFLTCLGELWCNGFIIDWEMFYNSENRRIISLPTYAFNRKKYWIEQYDMKLLKSDKENNKTSINKTKDEYNSENWLYAPIWKNSIVQKIEKPKCMGTWLMFIEEGDFNQKICSYLSSLDVNVITVKSGSEFKIINSREYEINPNSKEDYNKLIADIYEKNKKINNILHLWCTQEKSLKISRLDYAKKCEVYGFLSLLYLAQALSNQNFDNKVRLGVITNNLYSITGENILYPEHALILGPAKVITREFQNLIGQSIDISFPEPNSNEENLLIKSIINEITDVNINLNTALRGNQRWYIDYEKHDINQYDKSKILKENGVYLITGGLGGIGLELASFIAQQVKATLILAGRRKFPGKEEWDSYISKNNKNDRIQKIINKLKMIEKMGSCVNVVSADVTNLDEMKTVISEVEEQNGKITGIIHAAGIVENGVIKDKKFETAQKVFLPKVTGTLVLNEIFKGRKLDFLILFSSSSAILGNVGFVDYCSANGFLDCFAQYNNINNDTYTLAVNWDEWANLGMSEGSNFSQIIKDKITVDKGFPILQDIINSKIYPQAIVTPGNFNKMIDDINNFLKSSIGLKKKNNNKNIENNRPDLITPYVSPESETEIILSNIWKELLGINPIGINDDFFDLGGHSLLATTLISDIGKKFKVNIDLNELFDKATIADLSELIEEEKMDNMVDEDVIYEEGMI